MLTLRTPDERFAGLPGFDFAPHYAEVADGDGGTLRVHYLREGDPAAPVVLLMHGEPSWSYLYRKMIPVLTAAGLQIVAPDLVGFGRSDKPTERGDYTFARHVEWMRELLFDRLDLRDVTLVGQDWGGLIGLRLVGEHPERFARVVAANTFLPTGDTEPGRGLLRLAEVLPGGRGVPDRRHRAGRLRQGDHRRDPGRLRRARSPTSPTRRAPAPSPCSSRRGPTTPPTTPTWPPGWAWPPSTGPSCAPSATATPSPRGADRNLKERIAGAKGQPHTTIVGGGHFLQEDCGEELAQVVVDFVRANP